MACHQVAKRSIQLLLNSTKRQPARTYSSRAFTGDRYVTSAYLLRLSEMGACKHTILINKLKERTSAPIEDVKSVLVSSNWDIVAAQKELRKRGVLFASKKSSRAVEGLLAVAQTDKKAVVIELNCETDFVARYDVVEYLASSLARTALVTEGPLETTSEAFSFGLEYLEHMKINLDHPKLSGEATVQNAVTEVAAMVGESVKFRRGFILSASSHGVVSAYRHESRCTGFNHVAGLVSLEVEDGNPKLEVLKSEAYMLAIHVCLASPLFLSRELVSSEALENQRVILKSEEYLRWTWRKLCRGLRKYLEHVVLLKQKHVFDEKATVKSVLNDFSKQWGSKVKIGNFLRVEVGEGVQRTEVSETPDAVQQSA